MAKVGVANSVVGVGAVFRGGDLGFVDEGFED